MTHSSIIRYLAASAALVALTGAAAAAPAIGMTGDRTLVWFNTDRPEITRTVEVEGVEMLQGIDLRPADNRLYGITKDGTVVTIDVETGVATAGAKLAINLPDGVMASVDFNPMADRLRLMGSDGTNLRANVDTGEVTEDGRLAFEAGDANAETEPKVLATAYMNAFGKPEATAMYNVDAAGTFIHQTKPNDGVLKTIGSLGIPASETMAMDIQTTADGTNTVWLAAGDALYTIAVETGVATKTGDITGTPGMLRDIAILPAM